jgi:DNA-binding CsgD family transcriptional regulator
MSTHSSPSYPPPRRAGANEADPHARRDTERGLAALMALADVLRGWDCFERGSEMLLREMAAALGQSAGILWLPQSGVLVPRAIGSVRGHDLAMLRSGPGSLRLAPGIGLAGCAWERATPIEPGGARAEGLGGEPSGPVGPLRPSVALPALAGEEVLGVIELYTAAAEETHSKQLMRVLSAVGHLLGMFFARRRGELSLSPLTPRELEVLRVMAHGLTVRHAAERLSISPATVKTHLEHIYYKLGVRERTSAVASALRSGLID